MQTNPPSPQSGIPPVKMLETPQGRPLAYRHAAGTGPTVLYLPGYASDMMATKAQSVAAGCAARGQACLRFDYSGTGVSSGEFADGTIGRWIEDALAVIDTVTDDRLVIVGSSMGGWIGLHCVLARPDRVKAFIGIAAAPDFTASLLSEMSDEKRKSLSEKKYFEKPTTPDPLRFYKGLIEDGQHHLLLENPLQIATPVVLLQGKLDQDVPWQTAERIARRIAPARAEIIYVDDGDHRLARPQDLALLETIVMRCSI